MFEFGSLSSQHTTLFDSGLSSALSNSTNNSITSGSPPTAFSSNYIERPGLLFQVSLSSDIPPPPVPCDLLHSSASEFSEP
ncbi:Protein CBG27056 [Caenorhabditis briggsae]|uniref:Protein CBG27056 n=1 Tax=Caenorhabditis briggsae TaxID=6238 RepID=B6IMC0_CAEBR|nr:Protein CBG27056 [Caenorhabditis briggsae]CAS01050.1 Protein CBG27056 [Caenorhabditis briggsae]